MERRSQDRRIQSPRRLTTTLLLQISVCSVALVLVISLSMFWVSYQDAKINLIEQISQDIEQRVARQSSFFQRIEDNSSILGREFLERYQLLGDDSQWARYFDQWYRETEPGVFRLRPEFYQGTVEADRVFQYISSFVGPRQHPLDDEQKRRLVLAQMVLNELAPAWRNTVANSHLSMPENMLVHYAEDYPWGLLADSSLVMTDYSVLRSTLQEFNPQRAANWTGLYYDLSADYWTITHQRPIDLDGRHLVNASFDVKLTTLIDELVVPETLSARHMILNQRGKLIAAQNAVGEPLKTEGVIRVEHLDDQIYQTVFNFLAEEDLQSQHVFKDVIADKVLIVHQVEGPDWWHVTLYPYQAIRMQALIQPVRLTVSSMLLLLMVLAIVYWFINLQVSRPLTRLAHIASMIDEDNYREVLQSDSATEKFRGEVKLVLRSFRTMALRFIGAQEELELRVKQRTSELARANEKLEQLAHLDGLTGLMNRRSFDRDLQQALSIVDEQPSILVLGDLDDFKSFNDNYGHEAGDRALQTISQYLQERCAGRVYRYGGEEIALLIPLSSLEHDTELLNRLCEGVEELAIEHDFRNSFVNRLTISMGAALLQAGDSADKAIQCADRQLYRAKSLDGNQVCYDISMRV